MQTNIDQKILKAVAVVSVFTIVMSSAVLFGWIIDFKPLFTIIAGVSVKFNTALAFLFTAGGLYFSMRKAKFFLWLNLICALVVIALASFSFMAYLEWDVPNVNELFVVDKYSKSYPGAMSPATAFCFILLGVSLIAVHFKNRSVKIASQGLLLFVLLIALVSTIAFILQVPSENKVFFLKTMAIRTSLLFLILSFAIGLKNYNLGFTGLVLGQGSGSKLLRKLLPFSIVVPLILSFVLLTITNSGFFSLGFNVVMYTVIFILLSLRYIFHISQGLNAADEKRKELEATLNESNQELSRFKHALDASSIVAITDAKGVINYVNDNFCQISQYSKEELIGSTHRIINSGRHTKGFFKNLWETIKAGDVWIGEIENKAKNGNYYWVHTVIVPFKNESGKIYQYLAIRQDITKRKVLSKEYSTLKDKNKEIEQFAYIASHDLQEPLRTVQNMVGYLDSQYRDKLDENASRSFAFINEATQRMSDLIKGLLDYSRIGGEKELVSVDCDLMVKNIISDLGKIIQEKEVDIEVRELPVINAYETELRLLFQNLISNAIKFSKKGEVPKIRIRAHKVSGSWQFEFQDYGIGIAKENQQKAFAIFQRLNNRKEYEGTGIGLAHCEKIAQLHGGKIWLHSELGEGCIFYVKIPIV